MKKLLFLSVLFLFATPVFADFTITRNTDNTNMIGETVYTDDLFLTTNNAVVTVGPAWYRAISPSAQSDWSFSSGGLLTLGTGGNFNVISDFTELGTWTVQECDDFVTGQDPCPTDPPPFIHSFTLSDTPPPPPPDPPASTTPLTTSEMIGLVSGIHFFFVSFIFMVWAFKQRKI